ncbi:hypothetical protein R1sor_003643 [Riccia sorocarpa]|uniref:RING-type E3 ubiquitin transferase n=1 Tax=Riccia sorocarpa TaxID=122646 RepID=A0ABD3H4B9_9MARC
MASGDRQSLEVLIAGLQKELARKNTFEDAAKSLTFMFRDVYRSASETEQKAMYAAACRAATLLQTRYTSPAFWTAGLKLFEQAEAVLDNPAEKRNIRGFLEKARAFLEEQTERQDLPPEMRAGPSSGGFLFEGQLTVGAEPARPPWLVNQTAIFDTLRANTNRLFNSNDANAEEEVTRRLQDILTTGGDPVPSAEFVGLEEAIAATLAEFGNAQRGPPPAAKAEVAKLPVIDVTEEVLTRIGSGTECAVCQEVLVVGDKMQEMPCKHSFHPNCLKPWLDEHNSCPICRYELPTDDREYELKKERDREFEEDRKGRENALPGGEYMYT